MNVAAKKPAVIAEIPILSSKVSHLGGNRSLREHWWEATNLTTRIALPHLQSQALINLGARRYSDATFDQAHTVQAIRYRTEAPGTYTGKHEVSESCSAN